MSALAQPWAELRNPADLLNSAILESRGGDVGAAQASMRAIAGSWPEWDEPWIRLGQSLRETGARDEAIAAYEAALARNPHRAEALISLGVLHLQSGDAAFANTLLAQATSRHPKNHEAWDALGITLLALGAPAKAADAFHQATELAPERLSYALHKADALEASGEAECAETLALGRLAANPLDGVAACIAGRAAHKRSDLAEAEALLEAARALLPGEAVPLKILGTLHMLAMRPERAVDLLREAHELAPDDFEIAHDFSIALYRLYRFAEADNILTAAIKRSGPVAYALCSRANSRAYLGDLDSAFADIAQAAEIEPNSLNPLRTRCTLLAYRSGTTGIELRDTMTALGRLLPRAEVQPHLNPHDPERKLRIGLLSNTLRTHPVGWLTLTGIQALNPDEFSVHCFGRFESEDRIAQSFARHAASWDGCESIGSQAIATLIRERSIDVLIDLSGYGDAGRIEVLALKPAPVQIKWVGMQCSTTGISEIDWFITDRWETPPGFERFYSERLLRLDDGYICYLPPPYAPEVSPLPALENGFITFGCFNNLGKFTDETLACWSAVLRAVPNSRLVLRCPQLSENATEIRLQQRCIEAGLDPARISFIGRTPHREFLAGYNDIDIALDPFPYSGGLTTCESLYMGVPVITRAGEIFAARHSVSHLSNAGLDDWIAADVPDYVARATRFASDLPALARLRAGLRDQVLASPLCDAPRFGRSLAKGLRHAWRIYCETPG